MVKNPRVTSLKTTHGNSVKKEYNTPADCPVFIVSRGKRYTHISFAKTRTQANTIKKSREKHTGISVIVVPFKIKRGRHKGKTIYHLYSYPQ